MGLQKTAGKYLIEPDREKAIGVAMDEARAGDIVLLAGKGHEDYQILADRTLEFDDREMARRALRERGYGETQAEFSTGSRKAAQGLARSALVSSVDEGARAEVRREPDR